MLHNYPLFVIDAQQITQKHRKKDRIIESVFYALSSMSLLDNFVHNSRREKC